MFSIFRRNIRKVKTGDVVVLKKGFVKDFPNISKNSVLTVEEVKNEQAIVVFMNDKGNKIFRESLPVEAIVKTG